jgi:transposase
MNEDIIMKPREQQRALVLAGVLDGRYPPEEAASVLKLSLRQLRRIKRAFVRDGPQTLVHGNRGRCPVHALASAVKEQILELALGRYAGCNDQHLSELLAEHEGIVLHRSSVRRVLRGAESAAAPRAEAPGAP